MTHRGSTEGRDSAERSIDGLAAVAGLSKERMRVWLLTNRQALTPAFVALEDARVLLARGATAASVLRAARAIEAVVARVLFQPLIMETINSASTLLAVVERLGKEDPSALRDAAFQSLMSATGLDLSNFRRPSSDQVLWAEIGLVERLRAKVASGTRLVVSDEARFAILVADATLYDLFPLLLERLGMHIHDHGRVCCDSLCVRQAH